MRQLSRSEERRDHGHGKRPRLRQQHYRRMASSSKEECAISKEENLKGMLDELQAEFAVFRESSAELEDELEKELGIVEARARKSEEELRQTKLAQKEATAQLVREVSELVDVYYCCSRRRDIHKPARVEWETRNKDRTVYLQKLIDCSVGCRSSGCGGTCCCGFVLFAWVVCHAHVEVKK